MIWITLGCFIALCLLIYIPPFLYFKYGKCKHFCHDVLGWCQPKEDEKLSFDGVTYHCHCKYCGKEIMQDSQGNWF